MRRYEVMVILDPSLDERTVAPSLDQFLTVVRNDGGTVEKVDVWGRRRLAYDIDKKSEGIYAVIDLSAEPATVKELDRHARWRARSSDMLRVSRLVIATPTSNVSTGHQIPLHDVLQTPAPTSTICQDIRTYNSRELISRYRVKGADSIGDGSTGWLWKQRRPTAARC